MNIKISYYNKDIARVIINEPKTYNSLSTKNLNDILTPLTQKLYKQETPEAQDPAQDSTDDEASDNTVDAEFEEVKEEEK